MMPMGFQNTFTRSEVSELIQKTREKLREKIESARREESELWYDTICSIVDAKTFRRIVDAKTLNKIREKVYEQEYKRFGLTPKKGT